MDAFTYTWLEPIQTFASLQDANVSVLDAVIAKTKPKIEKGTIKERLNHILMKPDGVAFMRFKI